MVLVKYVRFSVRLLGSLVGSRMGIRFVWSRGFPSSTPLGWMVGRVVRVGVLVWSWPRPDGGLEEVETRMESGVRLSRIVVSSKILILDPWPSGSCSSTFYVEFGLPLRDGRLLCQYDVECWWVVHDREDITRVSSPIVFRRKRIPGPKEETEGCSRGPSDPYVPLISSQTSSSSHPLVMSRPLSAWKCPLVF